VAWSCVPAARRLSSRLATAYGSSRAVDVRSRLHGCLNSCARTNRAGAMLDRLTLPGAARTAEERTSFGEGSREPDSDDRRTPAPGSPAGRRRQRRPITIAEDIEEQASRCRHSPRLSSRPSVT
jgi:hypothetical protein